LSHAGGNQGYYTCARKVAQKDTHDRKEVVVEKKFKGSVFLNSLHTGFCKGKGGLEMISVALVLIANLQEAPPHQGHVTPRWEKEHGGTQVFLQDKKSCTAIIEGKKNVTRRVDAGDFD